MPNKLTLTTQHPIAQCIDLRATFGARYKCENDESYDTEWPEFRAEEAPWLTLIPCRYGHIFPYGDMLLAATTDSIRIGKKLAGLNCTELHQDGDDGITVLFHVAHFDEVAQIMKPRRRRRLSAQQKQAAADRLARCRPAARDARGRFVSKKAKPAAKRTIGRRSRSTAWPAPKTGNPGRSRNPEKQGPGPVLRSNHHSPVHFTGARTRSNAKEG